MNSLQATSKVVKAKGLTGDKNQCPSCGELFLTSEAFDHHRVGKIGQQSCLDHEGKQDKDMRKNRQGYWFILPQ